jgi:hypothetical protein
VLLSTNVAIAERFWVPMIRSPSHGPGTERSPAFSGRSLIINTSPANLEDLLAIDLLGFRRSRPCEGI